MVVQFPAILQFPKDRISLSARQPLPPSLPFLVGACSSVSLSVFHSANPTIAGSQAPQPAVHVQGQEPLTASMLAAAPPQEQKQMLGKCPVLLVEEQGAWCQLVFPGIGYPCDADCSAPRGAFVPTYPDNAFKLGRQDHRDAAGNRQLGAAPHAGVPRVSPLQGGLPFRPCDFREWALGVFGEC